MKGCLFTTFFMKDALVENLHSARERPGPVSGTPQTTRRAVPTLGRRQCLPGVLVVLLEGFTEPAELEHCVVLQKQEILARRGDNGPSITF